MQKLCIWKFPHFLLSKKNSFCGNNLRKCGSVTEKNRKLQQTPCLVEGLKRIYYDNRDTQLLLDLLTASSGIGPCLKLLCLFDKSLQQRAQVENVVVIYYQGSWQQKHKKIGNLNLLTYLCLLFSNKPELIHGNFSRIYFSNSPI